MAEQGSNHNAESLNLPSAERRGRKPRAPVATPFCSLLRYHMERSGLSVRDMAEMTGIGAATVGHLLTGYVKPPIGDHLEAIIKALHLDGPEAEKLEIEALCGNAPPKLRAYVMELQRKAMGK